MKTPSPVAEGKLGQDTHGARAGGMGGKKGSGHGIPCKKFPSSEAGGK